jgi:hypothetical protein
MGLRRWFSKRKQEKKSVDQRASQYMLSSMYTQNMGKPLKCFLIETAEDILRHLERRRFMHASERYSLNSKFAYISAFLGGKGLAKATKRSLIKSL